MKAIVFLILVPSMLWAADGSKAELFEKHKKMIIEQIDHNIQMAQDLRNCVVGGKSVEEIKKCHQDHEKKAREYNERAAAERKGEAGEKTGK